MQKRTTGKDYFLFGLLALIIILIILSMYQRDREWTKLSAMEQALSDQSRDVSSLRSSLSAIQKKLANTNLRSTQQQESNSVVEAAVPKVFKRAWDATQQPKYAQGDWNVTAFGNSLKTISPLVSTDVYSSSVQRYVMESMLARDPDTLEWNGLLAKSWTISDDGLVINFKLRDDIAFSDGEPMDASDVVFTFNFIMNEKIQAPRERAYYEKIKSVIAKGTHEVEFVYKEPYFEALELAGGMDILAEHFYGPYLEKPQEFNESKGLLFGTGPYRLPSTKGWTPDQGGVELVRNTRYWGAVQPSFDRIIWKIIQNSSAELTTFRNGDIDVYGARPIEYEKLKSDQQIMDKSQNFEYMKPIAGYSYIGWNQEKEGSATLFADKRVRQAMTYLTDRKRIIEDIFLGYAEPAVSPFSPRSKQHNKDLLPRDFDLDKAKQLLKEVGYEDRDGNGVLEDEKGDNLEFELTYFQDSEDTKRMILLLKDIYAKAGVKLIPNPQEWPVMLEMMDKKSFDAIVLGWSSGIETDIYQMFHSSQTKTNGDNYINYKNPELDKYIDKARGIVDEDKRMPLWREAEKVMYEDQPYTFLLRRKSLLFIDKRIQNLEMTKLGLNMGKDIYPKEQYVPKSMQKYSH
ncbi:MAG: peptide-binding protein [Thiotrichaceae bacterium]